MANETNLAVPGRTSELVVIGGSAGGIEALRTIVQQLPVGYRGALLVVVHVPAHYPSHLPEILSRFGRLPATHARDNEPIQAGRILVAPPDHHLIVHDGRLRVSHGPRENRHRPSIDVLFRSAAAWHGPRVAAVVLSGGPGDGVGGAAAVTQAGGRLLVQDPDDATIGALPSSVIALARAHDIMPAEQIGQQLVSMSAASEYGHASTPDGDRRKEAARRQMAEQEWAAEREGWRPSSYACPDCSGALWERDDGEYLHFRCRVGHGFAADGLLDAKSEELETSLWSAINVMEERAELSERLAGRAIEHGFERSAARYQSVADEMRGHANRIRVSLGSTGPETMVEARTEEPA